MRLFERGEKVSRSNRVGHVHRRAVCAGLGLAVGGKVLERGDNVLLVFEGGVALKTLNCRDSHAGDQVRIFAVGLLDAAPAGFAGDVHHRRQCLVRAAAASLSAVIAKNGRPARD